MRPNSSGKFCTLSVKDSESLNLLISFVEAKVAGSERMAYMSCASGYTKC